MIKTQLEEDSEIQKVLKNNLKSSSSNNNKKGGSADNNDGSNKTTKLVNLNLNDVK